MSSPQTLQIRAQFPASSVLQIRACADPAVRLPLRHRRASNPSNTKSPAASDGAGSCVAQKATATSTYTIGVFRVTVACRNSLGTPRNRSRIWCHTVRPWRGTSYVGAVYSNSHRVIAYSKDTLLLSPQRSAFASDYLQHSNKLIPVREPPILLNAPQHNRRLPDTKVGAVSLPSWRNCQRARFTMTRSRPPILRR